MIMASKNPDIQAGLRLATSGELRRLREKLGLSRAAMAEFMYLSPVTYARLESLESSKGPVPRIWANSADRVSRFTASAERQLEILAEADISIKDLLPLHTAATLLGLPQEVVLAAVRRGEIQGRDLGVLGFWLPRDGLKDIRL